MSSTNTKTNIHEIKISSWEELKNELKKLPIYFVFRGQSNSNWNLESTLFRFTTANYINTMTANERYLEHSFKRRIQHYLSSETLPKNLLEWLALMQHYGVPTRLLDWTFSPYVASYFALENATKDSGFCALWAISELWCISQSLGVIKQNAPMPISEKFEKQVNHEEMFDLGCDEAQTIFRKSQYGVTVITNPYHENDRQTIQQGLLMISDNGGIMRALENYTSNNEKVLIKYIVPNTIRVEGLTDLHKMNITRATLFPGIDGFSQSLQYELLQKRNLADPLDLA